MAVPKKKTSQSRKNQRRSHLALKPINIVEDKFSGEYRLPHRLDLVEGVYRGRIIIQPKKKQTEPSE